MLRSQVLTTVLYSTVPKVAIKVASKSLKRKKHNFRFTDLSLCCGATKINLQTCALQPNMVIVYKSGGWIRQGDPSLSTPLLIRANVENLRDLRRKDDLSQS